MKHYNLKTLQLTKTGFTDLFILSSADTDFVLNATTAKVLTALAVGDVVQRVMSEVKTAVAGPTATLSVGVVGALTQFTAASDVATGTTVPYVAAVASVTPYPTNTAVNMVANTVISNVAVTAGEVWVWASISRVGDRVIQVN
jgi:hypothetical protein